MKLLKGTTAVLLFGAVTVAAAQTTSESFADQFKTMQSLQSVGTYAFKAAPTLGGGPTDPLVRQPFTDTFTQLQAESSNSGQWNVPEQEATSHYARSTDPVGNESFADMFARMQAASSNSGEWSQPMSPAQLAMGPASNGRVAGNEAVVPTFVQRIARALHPVY